MMRIASAIIPRKMSPAGLTSFTSPTLCPASSSINSAFGAVAQTPYRMNVAQEDPRDAEGIRQKDPRPQRVGRCGPPHACEA
jgi:hypothetical protein